MFPVVLGALACAILVLNVLLLLRVRAAGTSEARTCAEIRALRGELSASLQSFSSHTEGQFSRARSELNEAIAMSRRDQAGGMEQLRHSVESRLELVRTAVEQRLQAIQTDNAQKLEKMRETVDEKLQSTLEARLGESFRIVSERLEQVHRGLGEMQNLAAGVGDLKRVLSNVTTRGAWGEVQLENLLTQILSPDQFERNFSPAGNAERVEFAIRLPGAGQAPVWLPVDAKFPAETYQRLTAAAEDGDAAGVERCAKELETVIKACARTFSSKYLLPPRTTDFGILFLATEGLYAETLRRPGLAECLQQDFRVVLAGPTTFAALLNSLQMGFRTLAIQQRSGEVWKLLGDVKAQFGKYSDVLANIRKRLDQAVQTVDEAAVRTRAIERKLKDVETAEELPAGAGLHLVAGNEGD
ncbi:MAG TPA: DNA recombination protein RmuC [Bryobacteraceae bacterium]|jgi:DNA recombination protein RmuC|nr:DNA recombination protein RmuC [Bryobacteraceae bacterium]